MIDPKKALYQAQKIQEEFKIKKDYMISELRKLGFIISAPPQATFYIWANISELPQPLNQSFNFFEECLKEKVIIVPGTFFDVNPGQRRKESQYKNFVRISFGPSLESLKKGIHSIQKVVSKFKKNKPKSPKIESRKTKRVEILL